MSFSAMCVRVWAAARVLFIVIVCVWPCVCVRVRMRVEAILGACVFCHALHENVC